MAETMKTPVERLRDALTALTGEQTTLLQAADAQARALTDEEKGQLKDIQGKIDALGEEIALRAKAASQVSAPLPSPISTELEAAKAAGERAPITGKMRIGEDPKGGFESPQAWFRAVRSAAARPDLVDHRLKAYAAETTFANESAGPEGGWAAPSEYSKGIIEAVAGQASLLGRMRPMVSSSNVYVAPVDESTEWGTTGLQPYKTAEGAAGTRSNLAINQRTVVLYKALVTANVSEELATDNPATVSHMTRIMGRQLQGLLERWILRGSGVGEPLGILNSPALVSVSAEASGNGANTLIRQNLAKMVGRLIPGYEAESFIVASPSAKIAINDILLTAGGNTGAQLQAGFGAGILGLPVVTSMEAAAVGTVGDATVVAPSGFMALTRGGVNSQSTVFFAFDQGLTTLRSWIRYGQAPVLSGVVTPKLDTATTLSHCVTTATRSG